MMDDDEATRAIAALDALPATSRVRQQATHLAPHLFHYFVAAYPGRYPPLLATTLWADLPLVGPYSQAYWMGFALTILEDYRP